MLGRYGHHMVFAILIAMSASVLIRSDHAPAASRAEFLGVVSVAVLLLMAVMLGRRLRALKQELSQALRHKATLQREIEARELAYAKRFHARRVEETGQFASGIAHDFANILDLILGYVTQRDRILGVDTRAAQDAEIGRVLNGIEAAAMRGATVTRKLLAFSRLELSRPPPFDAALAIAELRPLLRHLLTSGIDLDLSLGHGPACIRFDRGEFDLMLLGIASNAHDAMPDGGCFRIAVEHEGQHVHIALSDTGHGMTPEVRERVFKPFFSTKASLGRPGLGLAVIRAQVVASDGDIWAESESDAGSTFHVLLPKAEVNEVI